MYVSECVSDLYRFLHIVSVSPQNGARSQGRTKPYTYQITPHLRTFWRIVYTTTMTNIRPPGFKFSTSESKVAPKPNRGRSLSSLDTSQRKPRNGSALPAGIPSCSSHLWPITTGLRIRESFVACIRPVFGRR